MSSSIFVKYVTRGSDYFQSSSGPPQKSGRPPATRSLAPVSNQFSASLTRFYRDFPKVCGVRRRDHNATSGSILAVAVSLAPHFWESEDWGRMCDVIVTYFVVDLQSDVVDYIVRNFGDVVQLS